MSQKKSDQELDYEFIDRILALESCDDAIREFEDFVQCPVCGARVNDYGAIVHKDPERYVN